MTYTNTGFSASPFANPFNCRQIANYRLVGVGLGKSNHTMRVDSKARLPDPKPLQRQDLMPSQLEIPNQLGACHYNSMIDVVGLQRAFPDLVVCPDGTMMDMKSRKVIVNPSKSKRCAPNEWVPTKMVSLFPEEVQPNSWNDHVQKSNANSQQNAMPRALDDKSSNEYWNTVQTEFDKFKMSNDQKQMLKDLEDGKLMKLSRLEDEV